MSEGWNRTLKLEIVREPYAEDLPLPSYATPGSAGLDLIAAIPETEPVVLEPGKRALVTTGLRIAVPLGYEAQVRARSGLAIKHGIGLVNAPGTIDSDYRGVVQVILINWGDAPFTIRRGDRIAQMVLCPIASAVLVECEELSGTERGSGGFGSTGVATPSTP